MSKPLLPDFDDVATVFWRLGSMFSPSQLHGHLMGQLAVGAESVEADWLDQAWQLIDAVESGAEEDNQLINELLVNTQAIFAEGSLDGQLLLPDDDVELSQRVECLGFWCQGFLTGFALAGKQRQSDKGEQAYSNEVSEALSDMASIAQIGLTEDDGEERHENDFFEVIEYVRLAAMNIYFECLPKQEPPVETAVKKKEGIKGPQGLFGKKQLH
ncbi:MAG: hypothetical protein ACJA0N_000925 [Pseudohongiellaceae bacterium]|jgi:uncharacterized protein YgfB (UPF0149 family)